MRAGAPHLRSAREGDPTVHHGRTLGLLDDIDAARIPEHLIGYRLRAGEADRLHSISFPGGSMSRYTRSMSQLEAPRAKRCPNTATSDIQDR